MSDILNSVFEARRNAVEELRSLYEEAGDEALSAEQVQTEERLSAAISDFEKREANLIKMAADEKRAADAAAASPVAGAKAPEAKPDVHAELRALARGERRSVEVGYEARDLLSNQTNAAEELVESSLFSEIHDLMVENSPIMGLARTIRTAGGADLVLPRVTSHSAASLVAEAGVIGESDPNFDTVTLGSYKYAFAVQISRELEQDSAFNVSGFVVQQGGAALGRGVDTAFVSGTGTPQPNGIVNATSGMTTAAVAAVTMDELIEAQHSVIAPQQAGAVWMFNDATIEAIRKLKDTDNNYLWQPSNQAGAPSMLLGKPVYTDPNIDVMATGNTFGVYGDPKGFYVRMAGGVSIDRSEHVGFLNDLVTYRFLVRVDSEIVDTTGIRTLDNA